MGIGENLTGGIVGSEEEGLEGGGGSGMARREGRGAIWTRLSSDLGKVILTVFLGLAFGVITYLIDGSKKRAMEYLTAYVVELSLSVDNLFVFLLIFNFFQVPREAQEPVLFWGILGAMVFRGGMIVIGEKLTTRFLPAQVFFAGVLIYSAAKIAFESDDAEEDLSNNKIVKFAKSIFVVSDRFNGAKFYTSENGKRVLTPLVVVLISIELSDVVFALDSVPAVLGISDDLFVIYTSNIFAILGLRSMYFVIADAIGNLRFLKPSLALVLGFIGLKMIAGVFGSHLGVEISLFVVVGTLCGGIALSYIFPSVENADEKPNETTV